MSTTPQRWTLWCANTHGHEMQESPNGPYVKFEDYQRELAAAQADLDRRLMMAEELLSDLASGYWTAILDDNDDPVTEKMWQRVLNYWRTWDSPQNVAPQTRRDSGVV